MAERNDKPIFNLKAVLMETDLKPDTLRAWERRYGLPQPKRTPGGHRIYSQRDVDIVKWLLARRAEGMRISQAADLWHSAIREGRDPLRETASTSPTQSSIESFGTNIEKSRVAWIQACKAFDDEGAEQILTQAFSRFPTETVVLQILGRGLVEIGSQWMEGTTTIQQEHFASAIAIRRLEALIAALPHPTLPGSILVGCPPEEHHTFSSLLITFFLRRVGRKVIYLGADVPLVRLKETLAQTTPALAIFAAQQLSTAASLLSISEILLKAGVPLAYGGVVFQRLPEIHRGIPGHYLEENLEHVPSIVEYILHSEPAIPEPSPIPTEYITARKRYLQRISAIERRVKEHPQLLHNSQFELAQANLELSRFLQAALSFGNLGAIRSEIEWIRSQLQKSSLFGEQLEAYLEIYQHALSQELGDDGTPILGYLSQFTINSVQVDTDGSQ